MKNPWSAVILLITVFVVITAKGDHTVWQSGTAGCERGNIVRAEMNTRGQVLERFLLTAAHARSEAAKVQRRQGENAEARFNERAAALWRDDLAPRIEDIELADCAEAYPKPFYLP